MASFIHLKQYLLLALLSTTTYLSTDAKHTFQSKIVGGSYVPKDEYPWFTTLVLLKKNNGQFRYTRGCGASLIAPDIVLTAAHCVAAWEAEFPNKDLGVIVGAFQPLYDGTNGGQKSEVIAVKEVIIHSEYYDYDDDDYYDYALLHLKKSSSIKPVSIDKEGLSDSYENDYPNLWVIGHGATYQGDPFGSDDLKHVQLNYVKNRRCMKDFGYDQGQITENMMCAWNEGEDSCQGDSGGPLFDKQNNILVGVVSWGIGCAKAKYPGVYARISSQYTWIKNESCSRSNAFSELCENLVPTISPAPTKLSSHPTNLESESPSSAPTVECKDTTLDFLVKIKKGKRKYMNCAWAAKKKSKKRCAIAYVADACPLTCKRCDSCWDYDRRFRYFNATGDSVVATCYEVYFSPELCVDVEGVSEMCRFSCNKCK